MNEPLKNKTNSSATVLSKYQRRVISSIGFGGIILFTLKSFDSSFAIIALSTGNFDWWFSSLGFPVGLLVGIFYAH